MKNTKNKKNESSGHKPAQDKIHSMFGEEQAADQNLLYNKEKDSYEIDRKSEDPNYDHPLPYNTAAEDGSDDNSSYDEANPYERDEYAKKDTQVKDGLDDLGMHVDEDDDIVTVSPEDELLSRTPEDKRTDLDEEGYPLNDRGQKR